MEQNSSQDPRINALCRRLGHLWSKTKKTVVDEVVTEASLKEGERTIFGRLFGSPDVNFQALQATMKKAWKSESVVCSHLELGIFSFVFDSEEEKKRILESGPWSFSRNLLVLIPWEPNFFPQCSLFDSCAFWVHLIGLPVEGRKKEVISNIAEYIGKVVDVKIEARGYAAVTACKAKVILNLMSPLEPGMIYSYKGVEHWIDFRYERLPTFCYSCGKIGHYAQNCAEIQYDEERFATNGNSMYGSWLKTEANSFSPFWKAFYETYTMENMEEEEIPETTVMADVSHSTQRKAGENECRDGGREERGKRKMNEGDMSIPDSGSQVSRILALELPSIQPSSNLLEENKLKQLNRTSKKIRKLTPTGKQKVQIHLLDEENLLETPIGSAVDLKGRALVACPNKPPGYK